MNKLRSTFLLLSTCFVLTATAGTPVQSQEDVPPQLRAFAQRIQTMHPELSNKEVTKATLEENQARKDGYAEMSPHLRALTMRVQKMHPELSHQEVLEVVIEELK